MSTAIRTPTTQYDIATIMGGLYGDGTIGLKGAFLVSQAAARQLVREALTTARSGWACWARAS